MVWSSCLVNGFGIWIAVLTVISGYYFIRELIVVFSMYGVDVFVTVSDISILKFCFIQFNAIKWIEWFIWNI